MEGGRYLTSGRGQSPRGDHLQCGEITQLDGGRGAWLQPAGGDPRAGMGPIMPSELQLGAASMWERGQLNAWGRRHKQQIFPCLAFPLHLAFAGSHAVTGLSWREHAALRFVAHLRHLCLGSLSCMCRWAPSSPSCPAWHGSREAGRTVWSKTCILAGSSSRETLCIRRARDPYKSARHEETRKEAPGASPGRTHGPCAGRARPPQTEGGGRDPRFPPKSHLPNPARGWESCPRMGHITE